MTHQQQSRTPTLRERRNELRWIRAMPAFAALAWTGGALLPAVHGHDAIERGLVELLDLDGLHNSG